MSSDTRFFKRISVPLMSPENFRKDQPAKTPKLAGVGPTFSTGPLRLLSTEPLSATSSLRAESMSEQRSKFRTRAVAST